MHRRDASELSGAPVPLAWLVAAALGATACRLGFEPRVAPSEDAGVDATLPAFMIGGTVTGLTGAGLVLALEGGDEIAPTVDGEFVFATEIESGQPYSVSIATQPTGQACSVSNASGVVAGPVGDIAVQCFATGACPTMPLIFTTNGSFTIPAGCTTMIVDAMGGGGAGGAKNKGIAAAAGGNGGHATKTLTGLTTDTVFTIVIGLGGLCESRLAVAGGYAGGGGGKNSGFGDGEAGGGAAPGGLGGAGSIGTQPGGAGGNGGYGGGGGGGGGDLENGNSGGGATTVRIGSTDYVVAGGGGGAGAADQNGDISGAGGAACVGTSGEAGQAAVAGTRSAGGGGGGACFCLDGCDATPTPTGGAPGIAGTMGSVCDAAQNGASGKVVLSFP